MWYICFIVVEVIMTTRGKGTRDLETCKSAFIAKALLKNPTFNYDKFVYTTMVRKGEIICDRGHSFFQSPQTHLIISGSGCKKCKQLEHITTKEFVKLCKEVHNQSSYDYSKVIYIDNKTNVLVICPNHGYFEIKPHLHLEGKGCKRCSLSQNTSGFSYPRRLRMSNDSYGGFDNLYLLKLESKQTSETFYKVGVTFNVDQRLLEMKKKYSVSILLLVRSTCEFIHNLEKQIIALKSDKKYKPSIAFCGSKKECFSNIDGILDHIPFDQVEVITDLLSQQEIAA